ncbi:transcription initiation factor TFIID subunit 12 [Rhypophila decipiens]
MNSGGGQDTPGQANSQPIGVVRQPPTMYRPEMMRNIPLLTEEEKKKYEAGLIVLWKTYESSASDSKERAEAQKKIQHFGTILNGKVATRKQAFAQRQAQQGQQGQQGQQQEQQGVPGAQGAQRIQAQQSVGQQGMGQPGQQPPGQRPIAQQPQSQPSQGAQNAQKPQMAHVGPSQPSMAGSVGAGAGIGAPATPTTSGMPTNNMAAVVPKMQEKYLLLAQELNIPAPANVADKAKWVSDLRTKFAQALMQMEAARVALNKIEAQVKEREKKGMPLTEEDKKMLKDRKDHHIIQFNNAKAWVDQVRNSQQKTPQNAAPSPANVAGAVGNQVNQARPQQQQAPNPINAPAAKAQAPPSAGLPNNSMQNPTAAVNAAFEVAKNQQIAATRVQGVNGGGGIQAGLQGTQTVHQPQAPSAAPPTASLHAHPAPISQNPLSQSATGHQQQQPSIKIEPGTQPRPVPAPINPAIATNVAGIPSAGTPTQNSALRIQTPQSAHTPTGTGPPPGPPRAFSHADAVFAASQNRTGSTAGPISSGTPASAQGVMGTAPQQQPQGHLHAHPTQQSTPASVVSAKLPIPKTLPERAMQPPTPVGPTGGIGNGRPTYSGGSGIAGGVMSQPALAKTPAYILEGEGERVLNKKKLDELVRQVCGGTAEGQEGNLLAPEVEESVLNLADAFMDSVIHQACRNAKERGSKVLEIRDIQLVLERTYNIRIPGYSSEELRTVRKVQPNAQWITKMSAVQAAKVMPGKGDL